jgi:hypothetical protein
MDWSKLSNQPARAFECASAYGMYLLSKNVDGKCSVRKRLDDPCDGTKEG